MVRAQGRTAQRERSRDAAELPQPSSPCSRDAVRCTKSWSPRSSRLTSCARFTTSEVDAFHQVHRCGIEIEARRATASNAIYRDLVQAMIMVHVDRLILAVQNAYRYESGGKPLVNRDCEITTSVAEALYGYDRIRLPYGLTVLGY